MKRLTTKWYKNGQISCYKVIQFETKEEIIDAIINENYSTPTENAINKLGQFEDFMEKWAFDHIEEMDKFLTSCEKSYLTQEKELQSYKKMWKDLKEFIIDSDIEFTIHGTTSVECEILNKMQELEKSVEGK